MRDWTLPAGELQRPARSTLWLLGVVLAGAMLTALGYGALALVGAPFLLACLIGLYGDARVFLWILILVSGIGFTWADATVKVGGNPVNVSGLHWGLAFLVAALMLVRERRLPMPGPLRLYGAFVGLEILGVLWAPNPFEGVKYAIMFAAPLLFFALAYGAVRDVRDLRALWGAYWVALALALAAAGALGVLNLLGLRTPGFIGPLGNRPLAIFLLPFAALAFAGWRYRGPAHLLLAFALLALIVMTLSRMALAAALALGWFALAGRPIRARVGALAAIALAGWMVLQVPPVRARFFPDRYASATAGGIGVSGRGANAALTVGGLDLTGRGLIWYRTAQHAMESPIVGHGTGSAHVFLVQALGAYGEAVAHPHNGYLRAFHDLGVFGLVLTLAFVAAMLWFFYGLHRKAAGPLAKELALAAALSWTAYAMMALTDNVMVYVTFFTQNVFILTALAMRAQELDTGAERGT